MEGEALCRAAAFFAELGFIPAGTARAPAYSDHVHACLNRAWRECLRRLASSRTIARVSSSGRQLRDRLEAADLLGDPLLLGMATADHPRAHHLDQRPVRGLQDSERPAALRGLGREAVRDGHPFRSRAFEAPRAAGRSGAPLNLPGAGAREKEDSG